MTTASPLSSPAQARSDLFLEGIFTGMIGALTVALWYFVLDLVSGRPLYTPALLGSVLLHGAAGTQHVAVAPTEVAAYTAVHFLLFIGFGLLFAYLMRLFEKFPIMFFVLLVLFLSFQIGFFGIDLALGAQLMGQLRPWTVVIANLLAVATMGLYQWKRHATAFGRIERLWQDEG